METSEQSGAGRDEADRYRRAAEETLDQLQWCIDYLHRIGKRRIAEAVADNHRIIRASLREGE